MEIDSKKPAILTEIFGNRKFLLSELGEILKALGSKTGEEELNRIMLELCTVGDGSVDINEFKAILCGSGDNEKLKHAFDLYDKDRNRNRKISASELHSILRDIGENFSLKNCRRMIRSVDVDGYGYLNFKELKKKLGRPSSSV